MSKKKTSNTTTTTDNFNMQMFGDNDPVVTDPTIPSGADTPSTVEEENDPPVTTTPTISGGTDPVIVPENDDTIGGGEAVQEKTFLEELIPGKTQSQVIQETPIAFEAFEIAKFRPTLANQIKRANNAANTTFNYLPY